MEQDRKELLRQRSELLLKKLEREKAKGKLKRTESAALPSSPRNASSPKFVRARTVPDLMPNTDTIEDEAEKKRQLLLKKKKLLLMAQKKKQILDERRRVLEERKSELLPAVEAQ